jgi:hypothetical protein
VFVLDHACASGEVLMVNLTDPMRITYADFLQAADAPAPSGQPLSPAIRMRVCLPTTAESRRHAREILIRLWVFESWRRCAWPLLIQVFDRKQTPSGFDQRGEQTNNHQSKRLHPSVVNAWRNMKPTTSNNPKQIIVCLTQGLFVGLRSRCYHHDQ